MERDTAQRETHVVPVTVEGAAMLIGLITETHLNGMSECVN